MPGSSSRNKPHIENKKLYVNANGNDEFLMDMKLLKDKIYGRSDDEGEVVNADDMKLNSKIVCGELAGFGKEREKKAYDDDSKFQKVENQARKRGREHNDWHVEEKLENTGLEEELDKRMKRRGGYSDKDEVYTYRESGSKSRDVKHQAGSENDNKHKNKKYRESSEKDRQQEDGNRDYKHRGERYREDVEQDHRHDREDSDRRKRSRDYSSEFETRNLKDDRYRKKSYRGGTLIKDDRADMLNRRRDGKDEVTRIVKDQRSESEKRFLSSDRGRPSSRNDDDDPIHHRSSPSGTFYPSHRVSKQEVHNVNSNRDDKTSSRSLDKIAHRFNDEPVQKGMRSDMHLSSIFPSPKNNEDRDLNRIDVRSNVDVKESGQWNFNSRIGAGPNMGIWSSGQTNWNHFPNWPSNLGNGAHMPFHHVRPPNFNPFMQQFRPPLFGGPPVNMNHGGMPFTGIAWSNQVAVAPSLHSWVYGDGSHEYGNWEHGTTQIDQSVHEPTDDVWMSQHTENEQSLVADTQQVTKVTKVDDTFISRVYLSKIDISEDLTRPELYDQCKRILGSDEESASDEFDCKILLSEEGEEDDITKGASAIHDSVYKKAMSLYTKQKDDAKLAEEAFKGAVFDESKIQKLDMVLVNRSDESISSSKKMDVEVDLSVEKENIESCQPETSDESISSSTKMDTEVDQPVQNNDKPSVAECEVKVKAKELNIPSGDGSLLDLTNVSSNELGSVDRTRIHQHSAESSH